MKRALFIIGSPFQAICATEAIKYYGIDKPNFVCFNNESVRNKTVPIIKNYGTIYYLDFENSGTKSLIKKVRNTIHENFQKVFIGDYFSYSQYVIASILISFGGSVIYLDDGNSTISIASPVFRKRGHTRNTKIGFLFYDLFLKLKKIKKCFFTIYDFNDGFPLPIEKNAFKSLVPQTNNPQKDVFVIGTNTNSMIFSDMSYADYLSKLAVLIKEKYPDENVYYCPHRRDKNNYMDLLYKMGWCLFDTNISVEVDFLQKRINPCFVVGFASSALLTLKKIYPASEICTIVFNLTSEDRNFRYRNIERYFENNGVNKIIIK